MSSNEDLPKDVSGSDGWRAHELSQLRRFRALSLRQKLEAVEGMADVVRRFDQMRREGKFRSGSHSPKSPETVKKQAVREPPAIYQGAPVSDDLELAGTARRTPQVTPQVIAVLQVAAQKANSRGELQKAAGIKDSEHFRKAYLEPLSSAGWLERTIPDKPRSRVQRYRTTEAGREAMGQVGR
jgi:hypothetical protein